MALKKIKVGDVYWHPAKSRGVYILKIESDFVYARAMLNTGLCNIWKGSRVPMAQARKDVAGAVRIRDARHWKAIVGSRP